MRLEIDIFKWYLAHRLALPGVQGYEIGHEIENPKNDDILIVANVGVSAIRDPLPPGVQQTCDVEYYVALDSDGKLWDVFVEHEHSKYLKERVGNAHDDVLIEAIRGKIDG